MAIEPHFFLAQHQGPMQRKAQMAGQTRCGTDAPCARSTLDYIAQPHYFAQLCRWKRFTSPLALVADYLRPSCCHGHAYKVLRVLSLRLEQVQRTWHQLYLKQPAATLGLNSCAECLCILAALANATLYMELEPDGAARKAHPLQYPKAAPKRIAVLHKGACWYKWAQKHLLPSQLQQSRAAIASTAHQCQDALLATEHWRHARCVELGKSTPRPPQPLPRRGKISERKLFRARQCEALTGHGDLSPSWQKAFHGCCH